MQGPLRIIYHNDNLPSNLRLCILAVNAPSTPAKNRKPGSAVAKAAEAKIAQHLATTPHEFAVTRFEQGLICAAAAFYRFYGVLLGREGRVRNISGQDNAILQQIMAASRPLAVTDIARFANRDDIANIQYSLKKLTRAGLIEKAGRTSARETSYVVTDLARGWTQDFLTAAPATVHRSGRADPRLRRSAGEEREPAQPDRRLL